jgi:3-(3-hydroxy-phenyl)propionate hydroxylase
VLKQLQALQAKPHAVPVTPLIVTPCPLNLPGLQVVVDTQGLVAQRYDATPGTAYLLRPDQHVVARWRHLDIGKLQAALARALGLPTEPPIGPT